MNPGPKKIRDFQWFAIIVCNILGSGILVLPRLVAAEASRDGWLSILVAGAGTWLLAYLVWRLCKKFPAKTLPEISMLVLGRPLGIIVSVAYAVYAFVFAGAVLRVFLELVKTWILIWTPAPLIVLSMLLPVVYICRMGVPTIGRLMEIVLLLTLGIFLLWLVPAGDFNLLNLKPVGVEGVWAVLRGAEKAGFSFLGFEVMLIFYPFLARRDRALRLTLLALAFVTAIYIGNAALIFGTRGVEYTMQQKWPLMSYLRVGQLPVVQRVDALVLFFWTAQIIVETTIQYFAGTFTLATLTKKRYHDVWALVCWPILYASGVIPIRLSQVFDWIDIVGRWGLLGVAAVVLILLATAKLRGMDESGEVEA